MTDSLRTKVRTGLVWSAARVLGGRLGGLLFFTLMARLLSTEDIGLFALCMVVVGLLNIVGDQGLSEAIVQRDAITQEQINTVFWLNFGVSIMLFLGLCIGASSIARLLNQPYLPNILIISAIAVPLTAISFSQMAMRRRAFQYKELAIATMLSTLASVVLGVAVALVGFGVWSMVVQMVSAAAFLSLLLWFRSSWRPSFRTDVAATLPLVKYGGNRLATVMLDFANTKYIDFFLAASLGASALGIYAVGSRVFQALMQAVGLTALEIAHNGFSRLSNNRNALLEAYYASMSATAIFGVPIFCLTAILAPSITVTLFGERWIASAEVMRLLCLLGAVQLLQFYNGTIFNAIGRPFISLQLQVVKVILTFSGFYFMRDSELHTLVLTYCISQLLVTPVSFYIAYRLVAVSVGELFLRLWPMLISYIVLFVTAWPLASALEARDIHPFIISVASAIVGGSSYMVCLWLIAPAKVSAALSALRKRPATPPGQTRNL